MASSTVKISGEIGGANIDATMAITGNASQRYDPTIAAAKTGALSTRTNNTDGELTMAASHGITTGAKIGLYWSGGKRYNVTVGTVSGNAVPISSGSGDNLPAQATNITAMVESVINMDLTGNELQAVSASVGSGTEAKRMTVNFWETTTLRMTKEIMKNSPYFWVTGGAWGTNPLATFAISHVTVSHEDSDASMQVNIGTMQNSVA